MVLVEAAGDGVASQPALGQELLCLHELRLVVTDGVMTEMVESLKRQKMQTESCHSILAQSFCSVLLTFLGKQKSPKITSFSEMHLAFEGTTG